VLDPPRNATDPLDRLGLNEGVLMAKADAYAGPASVTIVASEKTNAARIRSTIRGVEFAAVATASAGQRPSAGANFTHVIGQRFEWHGEMLSRGGALIGGQYTFPSGPNLVLEYYRQRRVGFIFARLSRGPSDLAFAPDALIIFGTHDGSVSVVPSLSIAAGRHTQVYVRSLINRAPRGGDLTVGLAVRL
jgi:hypothetical protein